VAGCQAHNLRRTFAIECLRNGMNVFILAKLMGHSDISVLRPYLALVEHDLQAAHAKASPVDKL
jgi:site-specific recombinase XerD